jgi:predicted N-acyltransferase
VTASLSAHFKCLFLYEQGCLPDKEVKNLHFECCYWAAIDYCIKNGLRRMEPGAGGGGKSSTLLFDIPVIVMVLVAKYLPHSIFLQTTSGLEVLIPL